MEWNKKKIVLYIRKDLSRIDYIDISSELTRYMTHKTNESIIHSISDKLSSPIETLKRRGIPVDRLLKTTKEQQPVKFNLNIQQNNSIQQSTEHQQRSDKHEQTNQLFQNGGTEGGFIQSLKE